MAEGGKGSIGSIGWLVMLCIFWCVVRLVYLAFLLVGRIVDQLTDCSAPLAIRTCDQS